MFAFRYCCCILAVVVCSSNLSYAQAPAVRQWRSVEGAVIEASFLGLAGDQVKIKRRDGVEFSVPLSRLSPADQAFAKSQAGGSGAATPGTAAVAAASAGGSEVPVADKVWPRTVALADKPEVEVVKEDEATKEFIYRSPHYEFVCDSRLGGNVVREFGRMFEATYLINCKLPLDLKPKPEPLREFFKARLFTAKEDYFNNGGIEGSAGVYRSGDKALMVPLSSLGVKMVGSRVSLDKTGDDDNATLIHEITHQMMNHWLPKLPTWYTEGSAEYVEMLEYNATGKFSLSGLRQRLESYAVRNNYWQQGPYKMLDLKELMEIDSRTWAAALTNPVQVPNVTGATQASQNYGSAGLLTYFFYHVDGNGDAAHMIAYLRELEGLNDEAAELAAVKKHLLRERSYEQLAADVAKGMKKAGVEIEFSPPGRNTSSSGG